jgi:hypothetical protein
MTYVFYIYRKVVFKKSSKKISVCSFAGRQIEEYFMNSIQDDAILVRIYASNFQHLENLRTPVKIQLF